MMLARPFRLMLAGLSLLGAATVCAGDPTPEQIEFFEKKIRPVLANSCYECHSAQTGKSKGGLTLDTRDAVLKGGNEGPVLVAGDPEKSRLLTAVRGDDPDTVMPPKGAKLTAEQIADIAAWIKMGAPDPRTGAVLTAIGKMVEQSATHWSFQPVNEPDVPPVENVEFIRNPVDNFILQHLESVGQYPNSRAGKRTLIRRATFDLHGIPPTKDEVTAFVADEAPDAYARLIDRLLESPRYGERWGRHWLDVARYADTNGAIFGGEDLYPYAYSYRDYVIESINADKPYNQFLLEQLAADYLVKGDDNRILAAQGFLTVGRRKDRRVDDDVYDDRIDTISRGVLGLTVSCARCHDHKLEPIYSRDYYGLYSILRSSVEPEVLPELKPAAETPEYAAFVQERNKLRKAFVEVVATHADRVSRDARERVGEYLQAVLDGKNQRTTDNNKLIAELINPRKLSDTFYNLHINKHKAWFDGNKPVLGLWQELAAVKEEERAAQVAPLVQKHAADATTNPRLAALLKEVQPKTVADVSALYGRMFKEVHDATAAAGEAKLAAAKLEQPTDAALSIKELEREINKRIAGALWDGPLTDPALEAVRKTMSFRESPTWPIPDYFRDYRVFSEDMTKLIDAASKPWQDLEKTHAGAPPRAMTLRDGPVYDGKVFVRGNPHIHGEPAPRQYLEAFGGAKKMAFPKDKSGRYELAQLIAAPDNPLTARVMVNRVWSWHFGAGLVRTPSDFGFRGERPTHPELLDYLTAWFVREGWSLKKLHRLLMTSATYQQSSVAGASIVKADPENRLWGRMNGRPLEFEAFRDAQLVVSNRLLEKVGGRAVDITRGDKDALRRTVYGLVDRKQLPNLFRNFDFPDPNYSAAQRSRTALTPQALFLLNSGFIIDNAKTLAGLAQPVAEKSPDAAIVQLYESILQRQPRWQEVQRALAFVEAYPKNDTVRPEATDWAYGRGSYDAASTSVRNFTPLLQYTGKAWQMPDKALGNLAISADGGEPGKGVDADAIRRWKAPLDGHLKLSGELTHPAKDGDGIVARVVLNGTKLIGEWAAKEKGVTTDIKTIEIKKGETLDFIVSGGKDPNADRFEWAPTITMLSADMPGIPGMKRTWDAKTDFMDIRQMPKPLTAWEELAQVLLLCNEFMYID